MRFIPSKGVDIPEATRIDWARLIERKLLRSGDIDGGTAFVRSGNRLVLGHMDNTGSMQFFDCIVTGIADLDRDGKDLDRGGKQTRHDY